MNSIRTNVLLAQIRLGVEYVVVGRRCGDGAVHLLYGRLEDLIETGGDPDARGGDHGFVSRPEAKELGDYGIPVLFEGLDSRAQALFAVSPAAVSIPVRLARVPE